ncbi:MAG: aspartate-semialdehyde dehydrogenase [Victivallaceae bacterium]|nr:aspartate-semialdehyde dehydrogenase [Victivallaceae bacterium]MDD4180862.1 aspartate-semialdehyde dehydrogenase [Victivallaceae bacterium]
MSKEFNIAIAGATGAVGIEMIQTLERRNFPIKNLKLLASARSAGKKLTYKGTEITIEELKHDSFKGIDIALFSAGGDITKEFARSVVDSGAILIDNSSVFRMDDSVPLIVPEVNPEDIKKHQGIIANPNCTTTIMLVAVNPLHRVKKLKRLVVSTYQAVSGAGAKGMDELRVQTQQALNNEPIVPKFFAHQIAFNLIPHIDAFNDNGYTKEELKMVYESRKMLHYPELMVSCTCVRVPIFRAHSEALNMEFEDEVSVEEVRAILKNAPGVTLVDDVANKKYPMPLDATHQDNVLVGRIRQDISCNNRKSIDMFISGDQVQKGAALNAVQIAELL